MYCEKCGTKIRKGTKYCNECGTRVSEEIKYSEEKPMESIINNNLVVTLTFTLLLVIILVIFCVSVLTNDTKGMHDENIAVEIQ